MNFLSFFMRHFGLFLALLLPGVALIYAENFFNFPSVFLRASRIPTISFFFISCAIFALFYAAGKLPRSRLLLRILATAFAAFCALVYSLNFFYLFIYNSTIDDAIYEAILRTNFAEAIEFVRAYFDLKIFAAFACCVGVLALIARLKISKIFSRKANLIFIIILLLAGANDLRRCITLNDFSRLQLNPISTAFKLIFTHQYSNYHLAHSGYQAAAEREIALAAQTTADTADTAYTADTAAAQAAAKSPLKAAENIAYIVLIIGETARRDEAYAHYKQFLNDPNTIAFSDVIAPYALTSQVLSLLINFANLDNISERKNYEHLDIVNLFKLAGYRTFWLSNQDYTADISAVSSFADYEFYFHKSTQDYFVFSYQNHDGVVLSKLPTLQLADDKNFLAVHLIGSHQFYKNRFPHEFAKLTAADVKDRPDLDAAGLSAVANYRNSLLYADWVLSQIRAHFASRDAVLIYLSDHGESLGDAEPGLFAHGVLKRQTAEVPFIISVTERFKQLHPALFERIVRAKNRPFMSDDLAHVLADMAGISASEYEPERSVINERYNAARKRLFGGKIDYDEELKAR